MYQVIDIVEGDDKAPDSIGLSEAYGSYDGYPGSWVQDYGHQEEVAELCLGIVVTPNTIQQHIGAIFCVCLIIFFQSRSFWHRVNTIYSYFEIL